MCFLVFFFENDFLKIINCKLWIINNYTIYTMLQFRQYWIFFKNVLSMFFQYDRGNSLLKYYKNSAVVIITQQPIFCISTLSNY